MPKTKKPAFAKDDSLKTRVGLIPAGTLLDVARVLEYGAQKYGADNWRKCDDWDRYYHAALRHLLAWRMGEPFDDDTRQNHLTHAICCLAFLLEHDEGRA
jgi:hypothetical protein